jgi:hypothetical protein
MPVTFAFYTTINLESWWFLYIILQKNVFPLIWFNGRDVRMYLAILVHRFNTMQQQMWLLF